MSVDLQRSVRILQGCVVLLTAAVAVLVARDVRRGSGDKQRLTELDVQRINIVEPGGRIRLVLSDKARFPGLILKGREHPHPRGVAGLLFFNDEGTEDGGLAYRGLRDDSGQVAEAELMFDQYDQDQTVGIEYDDQRGRRRAGLHVWDRPDTLPIERVLTRAESIGRMPEGPDRAKAQAALQGATGSTRLFAGKTADRSAVVALSDPQGHPRLRLLVDTTGDARIEFLDAGGRVASTLRAH
jgi:hypothetical protein